MRTAFGSEGMPRPVKLLLIANVAVFLVDYATRGTWLFQWMALEPSLFLKGHEYWRVWTYMFVHDFRPPFLHILFNMLMLWMFGVAVCQEMGERRFWWFYLLAGLFAGFCSLAFYAATDNASAVVGASGAIFALMVAFAVFFPTHTFLLFFIFPVQARYAVLIIGAIELMLITSNDRIAHIAHLGGALFAWVYLRWFRDFSPLEAWQRRGQQARIARDRRDEEQLQEAMIDIDPILRKISREGMQSLSPEEKRKLDRVSELKRRRRGGGGGNIVDMGDYR